MRTATTRAKQAFCESLDWPITVNWYDLVGIYEIDVDRRARLELTTYGVGGQYQGVRVDITSKTHGKIDSKIFLFDDYLDRNDRSDSRTSEGLSYPGADSNPCFMVIDHVGWGWYIAVPRTTEPFTSAVAAYINEWR